MDIKINTFLRLTECIKELIINVDSVYNMHTVYE